VIATVTFTFSRGEIAAGNSGDFPAMHSLPRPLPSFWRSLLNCGVFAAGLIGGCLLTHTVAPFPNVPDVSTKLAWLKAHRDDYDTLFIGSSRVRRQISPTLFDQQMKALGIETHSFNLGIDAMTFPELPYVLDLVLETKPERLKRVIIDLNPLRHRLLNPASGEPTLRDVYWHDFSRTAQVCESILRHSRRDDVSPTERISQLALHCSMMLQNFSNIGRGSAWPRFEGKRRAKTPPATVAHAGFSPVDDLMSPESAVAYTEKLAEMTALPQRVPAAHDPVLERELQRLTQKLERAGAKVFFFVGPTVSPNRPYIPSPAADAHPVTLAFDDPVKFPILYEPRHRYDLQHLNAAGANHFTELLAKRIAGYLTKPTPDHE